MSDHKAVKGSHSLSLHLFDFLEDCDLKTYNGANRVQKISEINDTLNGRCEKTVDMLLRELIQTGGEQDKARLKTCIGYIGAYLLQKLKLETPYTKRSSAEYDYRMFNLNPARPLKIINQQIFDQAEKDGFPPDFFRESYFDHVSINCMPDHADCNFSMFEDCDFSVCRIREACFDGTRIYSSAFHSSNLKFVTFFNASIAHTHFHDCALSHVSFQGAQLNSCNTIDCLMNEVGYLNATLDGRSFGRVTASGIKHLHTARITQGGATSEECDRNRQSIFRALQGQDMDASPVPAPPCKPNKRAGPTR